MISSSTAMLELFPAAAGAGIVPACLLRSFVFLRFYKPTGHTMLCLPCFRHLLENGIRMFEKYFVRLTKMILTMILRVVQPILRASAPAVFQPTAFFTCGRTPGFLLAESLLSRRIQEVYQPIFRYIPQPPLRLHEEITDIHIAVVFDDDVIPTILEQCAHRRF